MDDKEMQMKFIQWLSQDTGAKTEEELKQVLEQLQADKPALQAKLKEFQTAMSQTTDEPMFKQGGKMDYLNCLSLFKKGGKADCGCGKRPVQKAFLGSVIGAVKGASTILKGGASAVKGAQTLANVSKGAGMGLKAISAGKQIAGSLKPTASTAVTTNNVGSVGRINAPSLTTQTMPTFQVGMMSSPNDIPGGQVLYPPTMKPAVMKEKGGKLKPKMKR